jgi:hypothetical protein
VPEQPIEVRVSPSGFFDDQQALAVRFPEQQHWHLVRVDSMRNVVGVRSGMERSIETDWQPLAPPEQGDEEPAATTYELLDAAAERGHRCLDVGELPAEGAERDLWHRIALAVLDDPQLLPHWARAARVDADTWHRACNDLDAELQRTRKERDLAVAHDRQPYPTAWAYEQACRALRDKQARIDRALTVLDAPRDPFDDGGEKLTHLRAALQADQPVAEADRDQDAEPSTKRWISDREYEVGNELAGTPPDPSGRIVDHGPVEPFRDADFADLTPTSTEVVAGD